MKCNKIRWRSEIDAMIALSNAQNSGAEHAKTEKRYYKCPRCKGWHLTSKATAPTPHTPPRCVAWRPSASAFT